MNIKKRKRAIAQQHQQRKREGTRKAKRRQDKGGPSASHISSTAQVLALLQSQLCLAKSCAQTKEDEALVRFLQDEIHFFEMTTQSTSNKQQKTASTTPSQPNVSYDPARYEVREVAARGYCFYESVASHVDMAWRDVKQTILFRLIQLPLARRQLICDVWRLEYPMQPTVNAADTNEFRMAVESLYGTINGQMGDDKWADQIIVGLLADCFPHHAVIIHRANYHQPWLASNVAEIAPDGTRAPVIRLLQDLDDDGEPFHFRPLHEKGVGRGAVTAISMTN